MTTQKDLDELLLEVSRLAIDTEPAKTHYQVAALVWKAFFLGKTYAEKLDDFMATADIPF